MPRSVKKTCQICNDKESHRPVLIRHMNSEHNLQEWNLVELCDVHRVIWIYSGVKIFCFQFPKMKRILEEKGWILTKSGMSHPKQKSNPPL